MTDLPARPHPLRLSPRTLLLLGAAAVVVVVAVVAIVLLVNKDSDEPAYAYVSETELALVRGEQVIYRAAGAFGGHSRHRPFFTADGGFVAAVENDGGPDAAIVTLDTSNGTRRSVACGGCAAAAAAGGSAIAWIDDQDRVMQADLKAGGVATQTSYRMPRRDESMGTLSPPALAGIVGEQLLVAEDRAAGASVQAGSITVLDPGGGMRRIQTDNVGRIAVSASGAVASVLQQRTNYCPSSSTIAVLDSVDGDLRATDLGALDQGEAGATSVTDLWWGRDGALYAVVSSERCDSYPTDVPLVAPSVWRLDRQKWTQVDRGPVASVRQLTSTRKAVVLPNGALYAVADGTGTEGTGTEGTGAAGTGTEVARGVQAIELAPAAADSTAKVASRDELAAFVGEWHVHGSALTVKSDGSATQDLDVGPCPDNPTLRCSAHATLTLSADAAGVTMTYTGVSIRDPDSAEVRGEVSGTVRVGDAFRLHLAGAGLLRVHPVTPNAASIIGNVYQCRSDASDEAHVLCNA